jgi:membrane associated rhomboid family serine protease
MLIPIRHENMSARRWPVITLSLIAVNTIIFLLTHFSMQEQAPQLGLLRVHILMLAAMHPELNIPAPADQMVNQYREQNKVWEAIKNENRAVEDAWDAHMRMTQDSEALQKEMDSMAEQYSQLASASISQQYGFVPAERRPISYITANFLHGGWFHIIGNMWFLWLAGFVLEDAWGRTIYTVFYFLAGAAALQFYAWTNPGSMGPAIGASGAVAALMGAFLVRFPKMKIEMMWLFRFRSFRFKAEAYWLLPLWLLMEIFYGTLFGSASGVAHWAHVGGFFCGGVVAYALRLTHLEHKVNTAIEQKTTWTSDPAIDEASELIEKGQTDNAIAVLNSYITSNPDSLDAWNLVQQTYWRKGDVPAFQEATLKLCSLNLKARDYQLAWQCCEEFRNTGGEKLPAGLWFDLCRGAESLKNFDLALQEYKKLGSAYPSERQSMLAQIAAGRLCLTQLHDPQAALAYFQAAAASPVPHLDWEQTIEAGIRNAKAALGTPQTAAAASAAK